MKRIMSSLVLLAGATLLVACNQSANKADSSSTKTQGAVHTATLIIKLPDETLEQAVNFESGDSVMDVLDDALEIEEEDGMVTEIEGVSQDVAKSTYWMYKVNDKIAEVGAEQLEVKANDRIEFYLETF